MVDYLVQKNVKEKLEKNVGKEFIERLDEKVEKDLVRSEERAEANNRKTVKARDV